ncbi:hypothetical protein QTG56_25725 (plasmid) [Rossellomorea sp. AcN35-11]|nr:hypothetical protein [Rossellomorea aquimaris]WJV32016.1 hypothetical protein QTG56_25725 [Rossellomorea sp. AcN35-11]
MEGYAEEISSMSETELVVETKDKIWESVFWSAQFHESHDQVSACYREWVKRDGNSHTYNTLHTEVRLEFSGK